MGSVSTADWYRSGRRGSINKYEGRKGLIASAARTCLERKGVAKTSIADITREVDITRELFYYYFPNKDSVVQAVVDGYVGDARQLLARATEDRGASAETLLVEVIGALREWLATDEAMPVTMMGVLRESGEWAMTLYVVAGEALEAVRGTALLAEGDAVDEPTSCGRKIALVGAMNSMLCIETLTDEGIAQGIAPLFY